VHVAEIYERLRNDGEANGDFNDTPQGAPLSPLLAQTNLRDISDHQSFADDGREGTSGDGRPSQKFDYVLLSPALFQRVTGGGYFRTGILGRRQRRLVADLPDDDAAGACGV
jgi:hypothetical protein